MRLFGLAQPCFRICFAKGANAGGVAQRLQGVLHRGYVVLGQRARIGTRIGQHLVLLVQRLGQRQSHTRGKPEATVRFALQAGEIEQQRRELRRGLGFLAREAFLAAAGGDDCGGRVGAPQSLGLALDVLVFLELGIEPAPAILAGLGAEACVHFPVVARRKRTDLVLALHQNRERRRLNASDRGQIEATLLGIEGGHGARAVDADEPVGLGAALGRIGERQQLLVGPQPRETVADRLLRHRLQPKPLDRLRRLRVLHEIAEDELAFAAGIAGVDETAYVLALHQAQQEVEALLAPVDRRELEMRRNQRQSREGPLAFLDVVLLRHHELEQMPYGGAHDVLVALEVVTFAREPAERARDVGRDRRFFGDDEFFTHAAKGRR